ncbi:hypothetical protein EYF80_057214 [Liparis tanakae]|uniref:Uncharacterized protein n=1 Tax=Liparis tanakae TaxID=230148 RepID=A0A4Z2EV08_9TELE|nr:hypothetical protein EYF80_057214 [Liparis tanakae]
MDPQRTPETPREPERFRNVPSGAALVWTRKSVSWCVQGHSSLTGFGRSVLGGLRGQTLCWDQNS